MPGSEDRFLQYNEENVIKHLLAIEDHARNLKEGYGPEHYACITKHSLQIEEQCDEGISHAAVLDTNKVGVFKEVRKRIADFRNKLKSDSSPDVAIKEIRSVRSVAERLGRGYDTSECRVCGDSESVPEVKTYLKGTQTMNKTGGKSMKLPSVPSGVKDVAMVLGGGIAGKIIETYLPSVIPQGQLVPGLNNGTLANIAVGVAIDALAITRPGMLGALEVPAVAAANFILADTLGDILLGYVTPAAAIPSAPAAAVMSFGGVRTNGSLIYVD